MLLYETFVKIIVFSILRDFMLQDVVIGVEWIEKVGIGKVLGLGKLFIGEGFELGKWKFFGISK